MAAVHEIACKGLLNPSGIPGIDYTVNPYTGCSHACAYCYARFMARHTAHGLPWGAFCDPKTNAPEVLAKEVRRKPPGRVSLSTVTDPYQPAEARYGLTRRLLEILADSGFTVSLLTKSDLVLRDLDVLSRFPPGTVEVGFSLNSSDDAVRRAFEPGAPPVSARLDALETLAGAGVPTWVFLAPALPVLTESGLESLVGRIASGTGRMLADRLNLKCGNQGPVWRVLSARFPSVVPEWNRLLRGPDRGDAYFSGLFDRLDSLCREKGLAFERC
jgi:DNA repair photolyase